ncbi:replication initiator protein A [Paracoccus aerius]
MEVKAVLTRSALLFASGLFSARKPIERRIYEIARKFCGHFGK